MYEAITPSADLDDHALAASIAEHARAEWMAAGARMDAIAELGVRRLGSQRARDRVHMKVDGWASVTAEIAAELVTGTRTASGLLHQALDLRFRLTRLGALVREGRVALKVASAACYRTMLILDEDLLAKVDADITAAATRWGNYSARALTTAIDTIVARHDPDAVRRFRNAQHALHLRFGSRDDPPGTRSVNGRMSIITADLLERAADALAAGVCPDDPRPIGVRRDDAYGVLAVGGTHLPCNCGRSDCPATGPDPRAAHLGILILTDNPDGGTTPPQDPPAPDPDPDDDPGDPPPGPRPGYRIWPDEYDMSIHWHDHPDNQPEPESESDVETDTATESDVESESDTTATTPETKPQSPSRPRTEFSAAATPPAPETEPAPAPCQYTAVTTGGALIPPPLLHDLRMIGVAARTVTAAEVTAEPRYRPSAAQKRFIRARDVTCCFIGCDRPAQYCDVDHTRPYASSRLTHPANTKSLCRLHHLMKTFWIGDGGWHDEQLDDGTIVWTTPSGRRHRAPPRSRLHFPTWDTTTPLPADTPPPAADDPPAPGRDLRMPRRARTRAEQHHRDVITEREWRNHAYDNDPPPF